MRWSLKLCLGIWDIFLLFAILILQEELGIVECSFVFIEEGEHEPCPRTEVVYRRAESMRCLYGCPMANSVEEAVNQAEKYSENESSVTSGKIIID